jgi:hypothetical protein
MVTSTVLTLLVIPALYVSWRGFQHRKEFRSQPEAAVTGKADSGDRAADDRIRG